ncbi:MAG: glycoside hydrolase 43 family protein [Melioribacteraceae bacterium]|nr:glycoside hydrolase 43 family protein [Melioribacteraceae bacterium]
MRFVNDFFRASVILLFVFNHAFYSQKQEVSKNSSVCGADNGDGTYKNPIIFADYSDPDLVRVNNEFFMVSSSFSHFPGIPVLHSKDLVNWHIIGHVALDYPFDEFKRPQHGKGIWAPSIRFHDDKFWVFFGDPDHGVIMSTSSKPEGPWEPLHLVKEAKGWIDTCPFWDDDGNAYLIRAWAKSRSGINSILSLHRMSYDGKTLLDSGTTIFDGHVNHPTIEGPKMYKRNGYYFIFAPAGGVKPGWQTVLRSKNIYGPYEDKIVLEQGSTNINGPHQGGWVELESGESWFVHFQDRDAYGRVVHLNPVYWIDDWPLMGIDLDGNGIGEPVHIFNKPDVGRKYPVNVPQTDDEFDSNQLGYQWQWEAIGSSSWYSLQKNKDHLTLNSVLIPENSGNLRDLPNILAQKFPSEEFTFTAKLKINDADMLGRTGLIILGQDYSSLEVRNLGKKLFISRTICSDADKSGEETISDSVEINPGIIYLKVYISKGAVCNFAYSIDNANYILSGKAFRAKAGRWVGAKIGLFNIHSKHEKGSDVLYDWVRVSPL